MPGALVTMRLGGFSTAARKSTSVPFTSLSRPGVIRQPDITHTHTHTRTHAVRKRKTPGTVPFDERRLSSAWLSWVSQFLVVAEPLLAPPI